MKQYDFKNKIRKHKKIIILQKHKNKYRWIKVLSTRIACHDHFLSRWIFRTVVLKVPSISLRSSYWYPILPIVEWPLVCPLVWPFDPFVIPLRLIGCFSSSLITYLIFLIARSVSSYDTSTWVRRRQTPGPKVLKFMIQTSSPSSVFSSSVTW